MNLKVFLHGSGKKRPCQAGGFEGGNRGPLEKGRRHEKDHATDNDVCSVLF